MSNREQYQGAGLKVSSLVKRFGAFTVTDQLNLEIRDREIHAVIGPNGAGKTTLINQLSGELTSDGGSIKFEGVEVGQLPVHTRARLGIARSYQITSVLQCREFMEN